MWRNLESGAGEGWWTNGWYENEDGDDVNNDGEQAMTNLLYHEINEFNVEKKLHLCMYSLPSILFRSCMTAGSVWFCNQVWSFDTYKLQWCASFYYDRTIPPLCITSLIVDVEVLWFVWGVTMDGFLLCMHMMICTKDSLCKIGIIEVASKPCWKIGSCGVGQAGAWDSSVAWTRVTCDVVDWSLIEMSASTQVFAGCFH